MIWKQEEIKHLLEKKEKSIHETSMELILNKEQIPLN